ncbi:unnamed protein product [Prorocentrum cordatum]|uniref:Fe2OG dioxygenase domain-containing protein n=1 Tax=Prorocentrum cordatum TaxID=2364126 RepID=A0ABN9Q0M6_9DINO|nr:unnamed protein product [Polarella glacialis]
MNNYGIILSDIGLEPFVDKLQGLLQPVGRLLFPGPGSDWDGHHCFTVRYRDGEDLGLDVHTDDSDVTFNVCLGLNFTGAGLQFCGAMGHAQHRRHSFTYQHEKGRCVVHLGRRRHGADDILSGERINLRRILWNHGSTYRKSGRYQRPPYAKEAGPPDAECVSYTHDRDYGRFKEYPVGRESFRGKGWCPPSSRRTTGFAPKWTPAQRSRGQATCGGRRGRGAAAAVVERAGLECPGTAGTDPCLGTFRGYPSLGVISQKRDDGRTMYWEAISRMTACLYMAGRFSFTRVRGI